MNESLNDMNSKFNASRYIFTVNALTFFLLYKSIDISDFLGDQVLSKMI